MTLRFRQARDLRAAVERAFRAERARIAAVLPEAEVRHTGGSSLPGALTLGDLDLHVRVPARRFERARERLSAAYTPYRPEMWADGFATFVVGGARPDTGIALTALGGEHDRRFVAAWERLAADPELLAEYNALKLRHEGSTDVARYLAEKSELFSRLAPPGGGAGASPSTPS